MDLQPAACSPNPFARPIRCAAYSPPYSQGARAAEVALSDEMLDRIDKVLAPGTILNVADGGWENPGLAKWAPRRTR